MNDYIDRQAAIDAINRAVTKEVARWSIEELPSAEVEPVRRGKWIISSSDAEGVCTSCHYKIYGRPYNNTYLIVPYNYCPNCGAKMEVKR